MADRTDNILEQLMVTCQNRPVRFLGFTLLELLIVISIIGILISVGVASYSQAQIRGRNSRRTSDMKAVQNALEQYYSTSGQYVAATDMSGIGSIGTAYLPAGAPDDPKPGVDYTANGSTTTYCICAQMEPSGNTNGNSFSLNTCGIPSL